MIALARRALPAFAFPAAIARWFAEAGKPTPRQTDFKAVPTPAEPVQPNVWQCGARGL